MTGTPAAVSPYLTAAEAAGYLRTTVQGIYATSTIAQARIYDVRMFDGTGVNNPAGVVFLVLGWWFGRRA